MGGRGAGPRASPRRHLPIPRAGIYVINLEKTYEKLCLAARAIVAIENPQDIIAQSARPYGQVRGPGARPSRLAPGAGVTQSVGLAPRAALDRATPRVALDGPPLAPLALAACRPQVRALHWGQGAVRSAHARYVHEPAAEELRGAPPADRDGPAHGPPGAMRGGAGPGSAGDRIRV